ncbi:MAG: zinc-dependent metalloprotease [Bacteroidetes bacterium]|nr:zinc-dependent metalloprotease [Bacteroidota bacterium]
MIKKSILLLSLAAGLGQMASAQSCATDDVNREYLQKHPEIAKYKAQMEQEFQQALMKVRFSSTAAAKIVSPYTPTKDSDYALVYVPIVVHIVHEYGAEYVKDDDIYNWVDRMNVTYINKNSDTADVVGEFKPYIGNARIQFVLANKDPFGNPTTGITRRFSYLSRGGDDQAKQDLWAPDRYLNIWLINKIGRGATSGVVAAYSVFPSTAAAVPYTDGVIGGAAFISQNSGAPRTYEHEIGHYLNLYHPWNNSNQGAGVDCGDDEVDDTPPTTGHFGSTAPAAALHPNGAGNCNLDNVIYDYDTACIHYKGPGIPDPNFETLADVKDSIVYSPGDTLRYTYASSPYWKNLGTSNHDVVVMDRNLAPGIVRSVFGHINTHGGKAIEVRTDSAAVLNGLVSAAAQNGPFPFQHRPATLTGYWKYNNVGNNHGYIKLLMTRYDSVNHVRNTVTSTTYTLSGSQANWARFVIPVSYTTGDNPDSATIILSAGSDNNANWASGNYLDVDDIALMDGNDGYFKTFTNASGGQDTADYPDIANTQNIMDYSDCPKMFTLQQVDRMRSTLKSTVGNRMKLITPENMVVTGILDTAAWKPVKRADLKPVPDFSVEKSGNATERSYFLCASADKPFVFKSQSWRDTITATSWSIANGNTGTNTSISSAVTAPGWVDVTLTVTGNHSGDTTITRKAAVYAADPNNLKDPMNGYYQEFNADGDVANWPIFNYYNNDFKWELLDNNGFYDKSCIVYRGYDKRVYPASLTGAPAVHEPASGALLSKDYDDFFTTGFNLSNMKDGECNLNYMYSGASISADPSILVDTLEIAYSTTCGTSFTTFAYLTKDQIFNKGQYTDPYAPLWLGDWALQSVKIPATARTEQVYFRFRYKPNSDASRNEMGISNNFYIDRINISPFPLGVNTLVGKDKNIALAPNPTNGNAYVVINGEQGQTANIVVTDITGKVVYRTSQVLNDKLSRVEIPANAIAVKGMYLVQVAAGNQNYTDKLISY